MYYDNYTNENYFSDVDTDDIIDIINEAYDELDYRDTVLNELKFGTRMNMVRKRMEDVGAIRNKTREALDNYRYNRDQYRELKSTSNNPIDLLIAKNRTARHKSYFKNTLKDYKDDLHKAMRATNAVGRSINRDYLNRLK